MALIADEASGGIGIDAEWKTKDDGAQPSKFLSIAETVLYANGLRSFCWDVPLDTLRVLAKQHTPLKGATFRSLSHHLAPLSASRYRSPLAPSKMEVNPAGTALNLLLPWPTTLVAEEFHYLSQEKKRADDSLPPGYFRYQPRDDEPTESFAVRFSRTMKMAQKHACKIDAIVFPAARLE